MRTHRFPSVVAASALLAALVGALPAQAHELKGSTSADLALAQQVQTALLAQASFQHPGTDLTITVHQGHVALSGWVGHTENTSTAQDLAAAVPGVTGVSSQLRAWATSSDPLAGLTGRGAQALVAQDTAPTVQSAAQGAADAELAGKITARLMQAEPLREANSELKVKVQGGQVDLSGWVAYADDAQQLRQIVRSIPGVKAVNARFHSWSSDTRS